MSSINLKKYFRLFSYGFLFLILLMITFYYLVIQSGLHHSKEIESETKKININNLKKHVISLSGIGSRFSKKKDQLSYDISKRDLKIEYLCKELKSYGYLISKEKFETNKKDKGQIIKGVNVFATKVGSIYPNKIIEIGAHYDTRPDSPGADDNCSGVSATLEIARAIKAYKVSKSIRFCFFDLEELRMLGSFEHVSRIKKIETEMVEEMISLEMLAYAVKEDNTQTTPIRIPFLVDPPKKGNFISFISNWNSRESAYQFEAAVGLYTDLPTFGLKVLGGFLKDSARSDHYPYWQANYKAFMITDTANFRNPHYHKTTDLPTSLNYEFMHKTTMAVYAFLLHRAND